MTSTEHTPEISRPGGSSVTASQRQQKKRKPVAVFARTASRPIPRVARMMHVGDERGLRTLYLGARREPGLSRADVWEGLSVERIGPEFPLLNGTRPLTYVSSVVAYNIALYRALRRTRPAVVHASDIETMPASTIYRLGHQTRLIYNIHDNVAQRYRLPAVIRNLLNVVEGLFVRASDVALVPEGFRRDALPRWARSKVRIIRNTPRDLGRAPLPDPGAPIRIFFGGWLDWGRGLGQLLELVSENADFELVIAGEGSPDVIARVKANPRTRFLGFIGHEQVMRECAASHIIPALYDPRRLINRYAASNKLAEALSLGRPVLINNEMMIARELEPFDCTITTNYSSIRHVAPALRAELLDRKRFTILSNNARSTYEKLYSWDAAKALMHEVLD